MMQIQLSDLWETCKHCGGNRFEPPPTANAPGTNIESDVPQFSRASCEFCDGKGGKPTPAGEAILELVMKSDLFHRK
jgi:hypothetical protein